MKPTRLWWSALAFFRELYAGLGPSIGDRFKKSLPKLAARLLRAGPLVGAAMDMTGAKGVGAVTLGINGVPIWAYSPG